jgi:hypothetical protein
VLVIKHHSKKLICYSIFRALRVLPIAIAIPLLTHALPAAIVYCWLVMLSAGGGHQVMRLLFHLDARFSLAK